MQQLCGRVVILEQTDNSVALNYLQPVTMCMKSCFQFKLQEQKNIQLLTQLSNYEVVHLSCGHAVKMNNSGR